MNTGSYSRNQFYRKAWLIYTLTFMALAVFTVILFSMNGRSMIWNQDGLRQHFPALFYIRGYFRSFLKNIFRGSFVLPMFDFHLGQGSDILTTLNGYDFTDPASWLSVFVPEKYLEQFFPIYIFLKLYLGGLAFLVYCRVCELTDVLAAATGALVYSFSGISFFFGVFHPNYASAMYFLPLILAGVCLA